MNTIDELFIYVCCNKVSYLPTYLYCGLHNVQVLAQDTVLLVPFCCMPAMA